MSPPRQGIGLKKIGGLTKSAITFEPLVRFQFFKGQNGSKFDFLFKNRYETTRTTWYFCQKWRVLELCHQKLKATAQNKAI